MKIYEILSTQTYRQPRMTRQERHDVDDDDSIPAGWYSFVHKDKDDPHMVKKFKRPNKEDDGYDDYVNELRKNKLWSKNIHFPRVYNTNVSHYINPDHANGPEYEKGWDKNTYVDYTLERLIPYSNVSTQQLTSALSRYFKGPAVDQLVGTRVTG
jgi:hypothetical protein